MLDNSFDLLFLFRNKSEHFCSLRSHPCSSRSHPLTLRLAPNSFGILRLAPKNFGFLPRLSLSFLPKNIN